MVMIAPTMAAAWPAVDQPQIKDFGFLVVGPPGWRELRRVAGHRCGDAPRPPRPALAGRLWHSFHSLLRLTN
jgi:hypothetical protein